MSSRCVAFASSCARPSIAIDAICSKSTLVNWSLPSSASESGPAYRDPQIDDRRIGEARCAQLRGRVVEHRARRIEIAGTRRRVVVQGGARRGRIDDREGLDRRERDRARRPGREGVVRGPGHAQRVDRFVGDARESDEEHGHDDRQDDEKRRPDRAVSMVGGGRRRTGRHTTCLCWATRPSPRRCQGLIRHRTRWPLGGRRDRPEVRAACGRSLATAPNRRVPRSATRAPGRRPTGNRAVKAGDRPGTHRPTPSRGLGRRSHAGP